MTDCNPVKTPMNPNTKLSALPLADGGGLTHSFGGIPHAEVVGSLLYLSQITRPDIAYAVSKVASFCKNPSKEH